MIYTKNGDNGTSKNIKNISLPKDNILFDLLGTMDELSANLGLAKLDTSGVIHDTITALQTEFFDVNAYIAGGNPFDTEIGAKRLEKLIDAFSQKINLTSEFIVSGKTVSGAWLDVARTVARRAERVAVKASKIFLIKKNDVAYFNRLSDLLYILARYCDEKNPQTAEKPLLYSKTFNLKKAIELCERVLEKAAQMNILVVCAVCDGGGNLISLLRDDNAYIASVKVAQNKAYTAVALKMKTTEVEQLAKPGGQLYGVQHQDDKLVIFGGGIPLISGGNIVGGLGVSGGSLEQDIELAEYGGKLWEENI